MMEAAAIGDLLVILGKCVGPPRNPDGYAGQYRLNGGGWLTAQGTHLFDPPLTPGHAFGTDHLGRDIITRLIFGARISLSVGTLAVLISGAVGTALGVLSGYYGGMLDDVVYWFVNVQLAFPFILLAISAIAVLGPSLVNMIIVLAIGGGRPTCGSCAPRWWC